MRTLSFNAWSGTVDRWNKSNQTDQLARINECRRRGHDPVETPVGPMCFRCLKYFPDDVPADVNAGFRAVHDVPVPKRMPMTEFELQKSRNAQKNRRARIAADPIAYEAYRIAENERIRLRRAASR